MKLCYEGVARVAMSLLEGGDKQIYFEEAILPVLGGYTALPICTATRAAALQRSLYGTNLPHMSASCPI